MRKYSKQFTDLLIVCPNSRNVLFVKVTSHHRYVVGKHVAYEVIKLVRG